MKKQRMVILAASLAVLGMTGGAYAQSEAMKESYEANEDPLNMEGGDGAEGEQEPRSGVGGGESAASQESMEAIEAQTRGETEIEQDESMRELDAEGESDAAAEAQMKE
ncbi:hypothetical protein [Salinicola aestuarinus]|uniref:hypothetical protein n=1 Tax=Salinicola aestuarinus TaxID=1949082 RepID=UPI000DA12ECC|nr:hypothetical protein [Salinicola aestuarinus]